MTSPQQYTPQSPTLLDEIASAKRTADQILRNNPLTNAVISQGLMRWLGNYLQPSGEPVNFLWIGEFLPPDPAMGKPQKGVVLFRDDVTQGIYSFAMYDHNPGGGGLGLRQTIHLQSGDGIRLYEEARDWGLHYPQEMVPMGPNDQLVSNWPGTPVTPTSNWYTLWEGRMNVQGSQLDYRFFCATTSGATGNFRVKIDAQDGQPDMFSTVYAVPVTSFLFVQGFLDVRIHRGRTVTVKLEAQDTNSTGRAHATVVAFRNYTP